MAREQKSKEKRIYEILIQLHAGGAVEVSRLSELLGVSQVQIRSDLSWLEKVVPLVRHHGGATLDWVEAPNRGTLYAQKQGEDADEKRLVAAYVAAELIKPQDRLFLDVGTTIEALVTEIKRKSLAIRVATNAANFAMHFASARDAVYVQLGGCLMSEHLAFADAHDRIDTNTFFAERTKDFISKYWHGDCKAIIAGAGVTATGGLMVNSPALIAYKQVMIDACSEVIVLLTHSKFSKTSAATVTMCGAGPEDGVSSEKWKTDPWLSTNKPATVVIDSNWEGREQEQTFEEFKKRAKAGPGFEEITKKGGEYPNVRAFATEIYVTKPSSRMRK